MKVSFRHTDRESITAKIGLNHNMFNNKLRFQFNINDSYVTQQRAWYAAYLNALLENPTCLSMMKMEIIRNIK